MACDTNHEEKVRAHKVRGISTSMLCKNFAFKQVMRIGTLVSQTLFTSFCLRNVSHWSLVTFSIGLRRPLNRLCNIRDVAALLLAILFFVFYISLCVA